MKQKLSIRFHAVVLLCAALATCAIVTFEHAHAQSAGVLAQQTAAAHQSVDVLAASAEQQIAADDAAQSSLNQQIAALTSTNTQQAATIQTLESTFTWRDQEWVTWGMNCKAQVGGSGNGIGTQVTAPGAQFAIAPAAPALGASNYFDCYYTWDAAPNDAKTHFRFTIPWTFPTQADANASQALEMEIRQVVAGGNMGVLALQMNFSGKQLRIYDHVKKWFATGTAQPRFTPGVTYTVTLDGHREGTNVCYDAITINTAVTPLTYCYAMWDENWRPMMRVAGQLDGNGSGTAYSVKRGATMFTSW